MHTTDFVVMLFYKENVYTILKQHKDNVMVIIILKCFLTKKTLRFVVFDPSIASFATIMPRIILDFRFSRKA